MKSPNACGPLLTDLYELTMAAAYFAKDKQAERATFELSIRRLPENRSFLLAAGLEQAVEHLQNLKFAADDLRYLKRHPMFEKVPAAFFDYLATLRFTGDLWAAPEGSVVFAEEPLLRISAPVVEAQIAETFLLSMLTYQTMVATKAARIVEAAQGRRVVEFGSRRAHGPQAGLLAARAAYLAGCTATSNTLAGKEFGIPTVGTAAHSWTMAFEDEEKAFHAFLDVFGERSTLLLDTYDCLEGARIAANIRRSFKGVRIDSGDIVALSREVRQLLDSHGHMDASIMASGDLNEYRIREYLHAGAPLDSFGVGTDLVVSRDAPSLSGIFKLVEMERRGTIHYTAKFSDEKATWPGKKQVFRYSSATGSFAHDVIGRAQEENGDHVGAETLLRPVMENGKLLSPLPSLAEIRGLAASSLSRLPLRYRRLEQPDIYPVRRSQALEDLTEEVRERCLESNMEPSSSI
jgi:nicotinate phosphoribosyltransferase